MAGYAPLPDLPQPDVIETLSLEAILARKRALFLQLYPAYSAWLESDPAQKLIELSAYDEVTLRQRINDAARSNLLAYSTGLDLDHLAVFYGVERQTGETDDRFRLRIRGAIIGFSDAGTAQGYEYFALSSHPDIRAVAVFAEQSGDLAGLVTISLLPADGADTDAILEAANAVLQADNVRAAVDTVQVVIATALTVNVTATIVLQQGQPDSRIAEIETAFRAAFAEQRQLGWNVTRSWLIANLHRGGVYSVTLSAPTADVVVAANQYAALGTVTLINGGRNY